MYGTFDDPYCFPGTRILKNIPGIRDRRRLAQFEAIATTQRADEPLPTGRLGVAHYRALHRPLFQDIYRWAGKFRTVSMSKGRSTFCYPENIAREMEKLFGELKRKKFLKGVSAAVFATETAHFLAELNAIHPFREGNGHTQTTFVVLLGLHAGRIVRVERLRPRRFLAAMVASFGGSELPLRSELRAFID